MLQLEPLLSPALAVFCLRSAAWWLLSSRAIATLIHAYLKYARRRPSLRRLAAPVAFTAQTRATLEERTCVVVVVYDAD